MDYIMARTRFPSSLNNLSSAAHVIWIKEFNIIELTQLATWYDGDVWGDHSL